MDSVAGVLSSVVPATLIASALLTYPIARILLWSYRRSVERSMRSASGADESGPASSGTSAPPEASLTEVELDGGGAAGDVDLHLAPWRAAIVYAVAGALFSAVCVVARQLIINDGPPPPVRMLTLFWIHYWPGVLTINLITATPWRRSRAMALYFMVLGVLWAVVLVRNPAMRWYEIPLLWVLTNGASTVALRACLSQRIRAVGPLVLTFLVVATMGGGVLFNILVQQQTLFYAIAGVAFDLGVGGLQFFWGLQIVLMAAFGIAGWFLLRYLARQYERKRYSDEMLIVDAIWLLFGVETAITLTHAGGGWFFSGFAAFAVFKAATLIGFSLASRRRPAPRTLLLLRVFALGRRSERLFDAVRAHWLRQGPITLVAGPDLLTQTIEPHELLRFFTGRMASEFVADGADLERRLGKLDLLPDRDGRYRVDEFFCRPNTWQATMRALAARGDAVLMDLRGFTVANRGCVFELGELLNAVDLERVVLVVDETTDRSFLSDMLHYYWSRLADDSINRRLAAPAVRIVNMPRTLTTGAIRQLLAQLRAAAPLDERRTIMAA